MLTMKVKVKAGLPTIILGVMGVTGSGKSSFIKAASGREDVGVSSGLRGHTAKVQAYEFFTDDYNIVLVDTPGFNDTYKSDTEVLFELAKWLEVTYRQNVKLTGIIYLHRIMDVRMEGSAMTNLRMFRKLCGDDPLSHVVIASTFWGIIPDELSKAKEKELCETADFWGDMIEHGAQVTRHFGTRESAHEVLKLFVDKRPVAFEIQRELVDENIPLRATAAGHVVNEELAAQEEKHKQELERIQEEVNIALAEKDIKMEQIMKKEREKTEQRLNRIRKDQETWRQQRGEDIRKIELANDLRFKRMKMEHDRQTLEGERKRAEDQESFRDEMTRLQATNEALIDHGRGTRNVGGKFAQFAMTGLMAAIDPVAIPLAVGSLVELVNEMTGDGN